MLYLGANVPLKDADYVVQVKKPEYVYIHLTSLPGKLNLHKFVTTLGTSHPSTTILLSGAVADSIKVDTARNVTILQSLSSVIAYISKLEQ